MNNLQKYKWSQCQQCGDDIGLVGRWIEFISGDAHNCKNIKNPKLDKIKKIICYSIMIIIYTIGAVVVILGFLKMMGI